MVEEDVENKDVAVAVVGLKLVPEEVEEPADDDENVDDVVGALDLAVDEETEAYLDCCFR